MNQPATVVAPTTATALKSPWVVFGICGAAAYITTLDLSIVNVAFPEILRDFGISRSQASWIVTIYNIFFASLLVVGGKVADQVGRKRVFLTGVSVFTVGSFVCAIAPGLGVLVAGRAVQGIGGALLTPASLGLLLAAFPMERRTQIVSMWGGIGALGVASGPSLGAALIAATNWRAAFWVNVPICVGLALVGVTALTETPRSGSAHRPDYLGSGLITVSLASIALALSRSEVWGFSSVKTLATLVLGIGVIPVFIARQRRHPEPVLDLTLFTSRDFSVSSIFAVAFYAGFAASGLNNVLFLRQVWGYSVLKAGLLSAAAPLTVALLATFTGRRAAKIGFRPMLLAGSTIVVVGVAVQALVYDEVPQPVLFFLVAEFIAVGIASIIPVNSAAAVRTLPPARLSVGGAVNNTARQVGSVLGVAVLVAVLGTPAAGELLSAHRRGFWAILITYVVAGLIATQLPGKNKVQPAA